MLAALIHTASFTDLVHWVVAHGYLLFFLAALLEGPLVTAAAGVAAALGYYSIVVIVALSVVGDLIADIVYYTIGYWGRRTLITRYGHYVGLTHERIHSLERTLHRHLGKAMIVIKLSPAIPVPGLIMIGSTHAPLKRFIKISLLITLPKSLLFALVGFYAGKAYEHLNGTVAGSQYILFMVTIGIFAVYIAYQKLTKKIAEEIN